MAQGALDAPNHQGIGFWPSVHEHNRHERVHLNRVSKRRACAVRLVELKRNRLDCSIIERRHD
jgi:hypothetical protein